jgi:hypothetical protein
MVANPVQKPKRATPALFLSSAAVSVCVVYLVGSMSANRRPPLILTLAALASILLATVVVAIWFARTRRLRAWTAAASVKWNQLDSERRSHGTTTEVTVLSVNGLEPTGAWITIRWNRFDHVQRAWIEALPEPIWPGSVLLISPDAAQVMPGMPWPPVYLIRASDCLAWAPDTVDSLTPRPQG